MKSACVASQLGCLAHTVTPQMPTVPRPCNTFSHTKKNMRKKTHVYFQCTHKHDTHMVDASPIFNGHFAHIYTLLRNSKSFFQFFNFSTIFSAIASCITVCDVSQPLPLMFKRFSKTNISFLLRKLDPITFSPALLIKERLGNLVLSNPKKEHGLSNNKLTHHVCIQYSYCCVFVHICVFDVYARCCVYFFAALCVFPICLHYVVSF